MLCPTRPRVPHALSPSRDPLLPPGWLGGAWGCYPWGAPRAPVFFHLGNQSAPGTGDPPAEPKPVGDVAIPTTAAAPTATPRVLRHAAASAEAGEGN